MDKLGGDTWRPLKETREHIGRRHMETLEEDTWIHWKKTHGYIGRRHMNTLEGDTWIHWKETRETLEGDTDMNSWREGQYDNTGDCPKC